VSITYRFLYINPNSYIKLVLYKYLHSYVKVTFHTNLYVIDI